MSDKILRALMQLFAIIANTDEVGLRGREVVERFLKRQLGNNLVPLYLKVYDDFLESLKDRIVEGKIRKRTSVNSVKVLRICTDINRELEQKQKVIVLIRLLEFLHSAISTLSEQHLEFIQTVAETFTISKTDFENSFKLVNEEESVQSKDGEFLIISKSEESLADYKQIKKENLTGTIVFLRVCNPLLFLFKYLGPDQLMLDGRLINPDIVQVFEQGSVIRGSKMSALYYNDIIHKYEELNVNKNLTFRVDQLCYSFSKNKIGLHELSFSTSSKNLVGIMGNSGAGKTTMLNLLNGSVKPSSGRIQINGKDLHEHSLHGLTGNIPQDDLLVEELSVFQNLFFSSKLYFGGLDDKAIIEKVNHCLQLLGLYDIRDLQVGDPLNKFISGGQRKRLNIALELIREPEILFVDEPTSGLSSNDAENVMDLLKQLTMTGKLIFVVIHQPSSEIFKLFDQMLILDTGGYPVYFGNPVDSLRYFKQQMHYVDFENCECPECGNINPEELFRIIESKTVDEYGKATSHRKMYPEEWYKLYKTNFANQDSVTINAACDKQSLKDVKVASRFIQLKVYFQRNFLAKLNNRQYLAITLFEGPVLALIMGFALRSHGIGKPYQFGLNPNIPVYLFISTIVSLFLGLIVSADEIIQDKKILKRESFLRLSRNSYLFSKIAFLFLVSAVQSLLFLVIGNTILGFSGLLFNHWLVLFSVSCFANLLGLNISSGLKTRVAVYILIPFLVIPQIMLSGVMVKFEDLCPEMSNQSKVPLIGNIMASRWAFEALAVDRFKNNQYEAPFFEPDRQVSNSRYLTDYWTEQMQRQTTLLENLASEKPAPSDSIMAIANLIKDEIGFIKESNPQENINYTLLPDINASLPAYIDSCKKNTDSIEKYFIRKKNDVFAKKQELVLQLNEKLGVEAAKNFKNRYSNEQLEDMVLNSSVREKTIISGNRIVRKYEPVFISEYCNGRNPAPFYTHSKSFFGMQMETLWYNLIIIWLMAGLLYLVLYFDLLQKLLERKIRS